MSEWLLIKGGAVFDGLNPPMARGYVLVAGDTIQEVGPGDGPETGARGEPWGDPKSGGRVIDLQGRTLMPGLIDAHVHVCLDGSPQALDRYLNQSPELTTLRAQDALRRALIRGVTSVRDLACPLPLATALTAAQREGLFTGARFFTSGPALTTPGGHGHYFGLEVRGIDAVAGGVETLAAAGVHCIKVMGSGGNLTRGTNLYQNQFDDDEMAALVSAAHGMGKQVACHAHADSAIRQAAAAGVDSIEHGSYATPATVAHLAELGTALVPTLAPGEYAIPHMPPERQEDAQARVRQRMEVTRQAIAAGVPIAAGTDAGIPHMPHGHVADEVRILVELGLPPLAALQAATVKAAELLGISDRLGTIAAGKLADLIAVDGNPLADVGALQRVSLVVTSGSVFRAAAVTPS